MYDEVAFQVWRRHNDNLKSPAALPDKAKMGNVGQRGESHEAICRPVDIVAAADVGRLRKLQAEPAK